MQVISCNTVNVKKNSCKNNLWLVAEGRIIKFSWGCVCIVNTCTLYKPYNFEHFTSHEKHENYIVTIFFMFTVVYNLLYFVVRVYVVKFVIICLF